MFRVSRMFGSFGANSASSIRPPVSLSERSDSLRSDAVCGDGVDCGAVVAGDGEGDERRNSLSFNDRDEK